MSNDIILKGEKCFSFSFQLDVTLARRDLLISLIRQEVYPKKKHPWFLKNNQKGVE